MKFSKILYLELFFQYAIFLMYMLYHISSYNEFINTYCGEYYSLTVFLSVHEWLDIDMWNFLYALSSFSINSGMPQFLLYTIKGILQPKRLSFACFQAPYCANGFHYENWEKCIIITNALSLGIMFCNISQDFFHLTPLYAYSSLCKPSCMQLPFFCGNGSKSYNRFCLMASIYFLNSFFPFRLSSSLLIALWFSLFLISRFVGWIPNPWLTFTKDHGRRGGDNFQTAIGS